MSACSRRPPQTGLAGGTQKRRSELRRELARLHAEHLLIFVDAGRTRSVWHWANREVGGDGKVATKVFEEEFARGQSTDKLRAALDAMVFDVADFEDGDPSIVEVTRRLRRGLKVEDVTKRFFRQFADERRAFAAFIKGLGREGQRGEYTAVLLDRLMFCYFLQHKGFLGGGDTRYLGRALEQSRSRGKDRYYADFLRPLFFDGFARREAERGPGVRRLIGQVPYLNGGLFEPHRIERDTEAAGRPLAVPDAAFEALFDFFDGWRWTLDTRPLRSGREINPDVLGYIFEQFINYTERKENGSYYTKEDVTGYIARSTLLPWWLDRAAELAGHKPDTKAAKPLDLFAPGGPAHALLTADPVAYLWPEVRKGVLDAAGRELPPPRDWSAPATAEEAAAHPHALATETRLEFDARRRRCLDAHARVGSGGVASADDLVTLNLDLPRLCRDLAAGADAPLAHAMALALDGLTVLDPTCGSGAFLFAALNLLDPLAAAVDDRLRRHLDAGDLDPDLRHRFAARLQPADGSVAPEGYRRLKRLVVGNLFGVDLMPEAVEICKLRLFLRLVAELDDPAHVEPLPDIDFNVRRGNTLVGLATPAELRQSVFGTAEYDEIERGLVAASRHLVAFRHAQELGVESREPKENYRLALRRVADGLDGRLFAEQAPKGMKRDEFVATRRPFHWPAEFHDIMRDGGFACVIGNPPYVKASDVRKEYGIQGYRTDRVPDVYAVVMERCSDLVRRPGASGASPGRFGMIVPLSLAFSSRFRPIRRVLADDYAVNWFASFARIPAGLFDGDVRVRNTIHLARRASADHRTPVGLRPAFATVLHRWFEQARPHLFANLHYVAFDPRLFHTKQFDTKVKAGRPRRRPHLRRGGAALQHRPNRRGVPIAAGRGRPQDRGGGRQGRPARPALQEDGVQLARLFLRPAAELRPQGQEDAADAVRPHRFRGGDEPRSGVPVPQRQAPVALLVRGRRRLSRHPLDVRHLPAGPLGGAGGDAASPAVARRPAARGDGGERVIQAEREEAGRQLQPPPAAATSPMRPTASGPSTSA